MKNELCIRFENISNQKSNGLIYITTIYEISNSLLLGAGLEGLELNITRNYFYIAGIVAA